MKILELATTYATLLEPLRSAVQRRDRLIEQLKAHADAERNIKELGPINRTIAYALAQLRLNDRACKQLIGKGLLSSGDARKVLEQDKTPEGVFLFNYLVIFSEAIQDITPHLKELSRRIRNQTRKGTIEEVLQVESGLEMELQRLDRIIHENYHNQFVTLARREAPESKEARDVQRQQATLWTVVKIVAVLEIYLNSIGAEQTRSTTERYIRTTKKLYIITGGSGTGKSTVLEILKQRGFGVVEETARREFAKNPSLDRRDPQLQVYFAKIRAAEEARLQGICFLDRSIIDNLAYLEKYGLQTPAELTALIRQSKYEKEVFFMSMPPEERHGAPQTKNTYEASLKEHEALARIYEEHGYRIINVPFAPYAWQAAFILEKVKGLNNL
jgi:predicted ATPase